LSSQRWSYLNQDESDQDYVGTGTPLLQNTVQHTETEVPSLVLVQDTEAPPLEPKIPDEDTSNGLELTPSPSPLPKEDDLVAEMDSEQAVSPTLWTCFNREIIPGQQYFDGKRVLQDYLLRCQAKGCTHKVTLASLGTSLGNFFRHLQRRKLANLGTHRVKSSKDIGHQLLLAAKESKNREMIPPIDNQSELQSC
jgi:hypothetical protein